MADVTWLVQILAVLVVVLGVIVLYVAVLFSLAWFAHKAMKITKVWHFYSLAVSMRLHGKAADRLFWQAVQEKARRSRREATLIANTAMNNAPEESDEI
jgi:hypothetical protein